MMNEQLPAGQPPRPGVVTPPPWPSFGAWKANIAEDADQAQAPADDADETDSAPAPADDADETHSAPAPADDADETHSAPVPADSADETGHTLASAASAEATGRAQAPADSESDDEDDIGIVSPISDSSPEPAVRITAQAAPSSPEPAARITTQAVPRAEAPSELGAVHDRWRSIQAAFVDDPRSSVAAAAELAAKEIDDLVTRARERERQLRGEWDRADADTECLRQALRGYRGFIESLPIP
jgi:hypothetical protein